MRLQSLLKQRKPQPAGQSKEYQEQLAIEAIARRRYPDARIKEIQPGFYTDTRNYVWLVILDTNTPFTANGYAALGTVALTWLYTA